MIYRKLDLAGDYVLGTRDDFLQNSPETVKQAVLTRLKLWKGEWFIDLSDGTDWKDGVLGKRFKMRNPDSLIQGRILDTPGVTGISSYTSTFDGDTRKLTINAAVDTTYGAFTITETL